MKHIYWTLLGLIFLNISQVRAEEKLNLQIIYPKNSSTINAPSTFFMGNTNPQAKLKINGNKVKVYTDGGFVQVVPLKEGNNQVKIESSLNNKENKVVYYLNKPKMQKTILKSPMKIDSSSIKPDKSILCMKDDIIEVKMKASTGNLASFSIGSIKDIPMVEMPSAYTKTGVTFGKSFLTSKYPIKGIYKGIYRIQEGDNLNNIPIMVKLASNKTSITKIANSKITTLTEKSIPIVLEIIKNEAIIRVAPDESRLTPLPKGTRLNVIGKIGNDYKFKMGENMEGWISSADVKTLPAGTPLAKSVITSISTESTSKEIVIKIPLTEKIPYIVEQMPNSTMILTLYNAKAYLDIFKYPDDEFIKEIKWTQQYEDTFRLDITANSLQFWGYNAYYENNTLVLKLKKPPLVESQSSLKDKIITIDPGHGGSESGARTPTGICEKTVNLKISEYLKDELEKKGAIVYLTRTSDNQAVDLNQRIVSARINNSDILLSIHNNALPDGRNPYEEHGSSTYYYHLQSLPLARSIQKSLLENLKFKNYGLFWDSLALTRPTDFPAVLIEVGFMTYPDEYMKLVTDNFQKQSAQAICIGVENFFKPK